MHFLLSDCMFLHCDLFWIFALIFLNNLQQAFPTNHSVRVYSSAKLAVTSQSGRRCQKCPRTLDSYYGSAIWIPGKCRPLAPPMLAWNFLINTLAKHFFGLKCLEYISLTVHKEKNPAKIEYLWHKLQYMLSCLLPFPHSRANLVSADYDVSMSKLYTITLWHE